MPPSLLRPRQRIAFKSMTPDAPAVGYHEIKDLVDALTGAPLNPALGLYCCPHCQVFYQASSFVVLRAENAERCVSCLHIGLVPVSAQGQGHNVKPGGVTLENYRQSVGRVITFEGYVHRVQVSRRGLDYAVLFEDKPWSRGLKMVVFRRDVEAVGGGEFIQGLAGHTVRVRGLLHKNQDFGPEIIVSDRRQILEVH